MRPSGWLNIVRAGVVVITLAAFAPSGFAQTNVNGGGGTSAARDGRDDGTDYGWIGLLGLAGLAVLLRRRDTHGHDRSDRR